MRLGRAFLIVSLFSYVCALLLVMDDIAVALPVSNQGSIGSGFLMAGIILYGLMDNRLNLIWAGVFGSMALVSFLGLISWVDHLNGTNINLFMSAWDLLIGVAFVYESNMYVD